MKRAYLFIPVFFSFLFILKAQQQELVLKTVSVDTTSNQQIKLTWEYKDIDTAKMAIFRCENENQCANSPTIARVKMDPDSLTWIDEAAYVDSIYYYQIGWKLSGRSTPLNNMVLTANLSEDSCKNSVSLFWNSYMNMPDSLDCYKILYRIKMDSAFIFLDSIKGEHFTGFLYSPAKKLEFTKRFLDNYTNYEFVIQAINKTKTEFSFSNIVKFKTEYENFTPVPIHINCVSVTKDNYIHIDVNTDDYSNSFKKLYLYRDESVKPIDSEKSLHFKTIDSANYQSSIQYHFEDKLVHPNSTLYYYQAIAENICRVNDTSNIQTNILLQGDRWEKYLDSIQFMKFEFPTVETNSYDLFRLVNNVEHFVTGSLLKNTTYFIDVKPFIDDGDVVKFQIKSERGCVSNSLIVAHEPIVEFPDAFYPQGKNVENKTFYPILRFPSESHYLFVIYDRLGQELYSSPLPPVYGEYFNMQGRWDGTFRGKDCPSGIYAFQLSYRYNEGTKKYSKSGTFMLLR